MIFSVNVQIFQSTLPRGSDILDYHATLLGRRFQSTLPRGSDRLSGLISFIMPLFQSTLPRGSDLLGAFILLTSDISIHAPSRERRYAMISTTSDK